MTLAGLVVDWTRTWWLYLLPITDEEEGCEEEEPPVPLPLSEDILLKVIGMGDEDELA